jgi:hypothetical protein
MAALVRHRRIIVTQESLNATADSVLISDSGVSRNPALALASTNHEPSGLTGSRLTVPLLQI